jgi:sigma-B regulation protein RsbU (phosphoserine phosphatase)
MPAMMSLREFLRDRTVGLRGLPRPQRTRLMVAISIVGFSFGSLSTALASRVPEGWAFVPYSIGGLGLVGVYLLGRALSRAFQRNIEMEKDQQAARQIQLRLHPETLPQPPGYELADHYRAFRHVGGDYYETMLLDDRRLLLAIADVSGKGAGASLLTANLQAILKFVDFDEHPLDHTVAAINTHLCRHTEPDRFITMIVGVLDLESRRLTYVNAGHNPAMLHRDGRVERLESTAPPLGAIEGLAFPSAEARLSPGDSLVLYTDGLSERRNRTNAFFDEGGIEATLRANGHASARAILDGLVEASETFAGGTPPDDDTAILVVRALR